MNMKHRTIATLRGMLRTMPHTPSTTLEVDKDHSRNQGSVSTQNANP